MRTGELVSSGLEPARPSSSSNSSAAAAALSVDGVQSFVCSSSFFSIPSRAELSLETARSSARSASEFSEWTLTYSAPRNS